MANEFIVRNGLIALDNSIITGSLTVTGGITGSLLGIVSYALDSNLLDGQDSSVFATTGSNQFNGNQAITGSLTVTGQITAQTLNVQQVTSSIVYSSGSNIFGNSLSDTQQLTGSVSVTGSMSVNGTPVSVGTGSAGQVAFWDGTSSQTGSNNLFWNNTNGRLGIKTTNPLSDLHVNGSIRAYSTLQFEAPGTIHNINTGGGTGMVIIGSGGTPNNFLELRSTSALSSTGGHVKITTGNNGSQEVARFINGGSVLIGTTTDAGFRLDVNGTARVQGNLTTNLTAGSVPFIGESGLLSQDNTNLFWDNTNKRLGIGTNLPSQRFSVFGATTTIPNNSTWVTAGNPISSFYGEGESGNMDFFIGGASNISFGRPVLIGRKSRGTLGTPTAVVNGNSIFSFLSSAYSGTQFLNTASINMIVDGTVNTTTVPQAITFETGTTSRTERMRILSNGNILINTTTNAGFLLDVNGTARITSTLQTDVDAIFNGVNVGRGGGNISTNTRTGTSALLNNTTGANNTANGFQALFSNTTGGNNTANGASALQNNTTGNINTANGVSALRNNTTGSRNIAIGVDAGRFIADGSNLTITNDSVFLGTSTRALADNQTNQIVIGHNAIGLGSNSVVLGNDSITFTGLKGNVGINTTTNAGFRLDVNGTARVQGELTVNTIQIGLGGGAISSNTRVGNTALNANTTGIQNSAFGQNALQKTTTGGANTAIGQGSLTENLTSANNTAIGFASARNTTGGNNSVFGSASFLNNTSGSNNVTFGFNSGRYIADGTTNLTIANNSIFLGADTKALADNQTNQIVIGHNAIGLGSNTTVIGNSSTTFGRWYGSLLLGTTTNEASSILTMESTTQGFLPPRMTTTQKNAIASPATGLVVYDNTLNKLSVFTGLVWETITST
jgi:hypothetical protein